MSDNALFNEPHDDACDDNKCARCTAQAERFSELFPHLLFSLQEEDFYDIADQLVEIGMGSVAWWTMAVITSELTGDAGKIDRDMWREALEEGGYPPGYLDEIFDHAQAIFDRAHEQTNVVSDLFEKLVNAVDDMRVIRLLHVMFTSIAHEAVTRNMSEVAVRMWVVLAHDAAAYAIRDPRSTLRAAILCDSLRPDPARTIMDRLREGNILVTKHAMRGELAPLFYLLALASANSKSAYHDRLIMIKFDYEGNFDAMLDPDTVEEAAISGIEDVNQRAAVVMAKVVQRLANGESEEAVFDLVAEHASDIGFGARLVLMLAVSYSHYVADLMHHAVAADASLDE